jgi:hypothetical protein
MAGAEAAQHAATRSLAAAVLAEPLGLIEQAGLLIDHNTVLQIELAAVLNRCAAPPRRRNRL